MNGRISWDLIFNALEKWRDEFSAAKRASAGTGGPAVAEVAQGRDCELNIDKADRPWAVLVSTILSLRTKDDVTRAASRALLAKAPHPKKLLRLTEQEIERLIYPAGFYRTKAVQLKKIARILIDRHNGRVPPDMDALLELPGAGRKTANLVLTEAFGMYGICVDIHVHRICGRAGWIDASTPDKTEMALRKILPAKYWKRINGILVFYGQNICRPVSPFCSKCVIKKYCSQNGIERSR
jgi:endonuclease-3